jgi:hypothetical protein
MYISYRHPLAPVFYAAIRQRLHRPLLWPDHDRLVPYAGSSRRLPSLRYLHVFKAFNPWYGIKLLINYKEGFYILGGVFLCTTGAEALYSDLGHCGKWNIRYSWIFVKSCLILNYLGQGAWLLNNMNGKPSLPP